jgi:hypothetical protein
VLGLDIGFIGHFNIQVEITCNYNATADFRTLKITPNLSQHAVSSLDVSCYRLLTIPIPLLRDSSPLSTAAPFQLPILQSQIYVTTDCQSASLSSNKALWGLRADLYYCHTVAGLLIWGALSDERTGLSFARVTVSSNKSVVSMYNLYFTCY